MAFIMFINLHDFNVWFAERCTTYMFKFKRISHVCIYTYVCVYTHIHIHVCIYLVQYM